MSDTTTQPVDASSHGMSSRSSKRLGFRRGALVALLATTLVITATIAAACGGSSGSTATASPSAASAPSTLTVAISVKPATLDPDLAYSPTDIGILHLIGGNLFELMGKGQLTPVLAESLTVSKDGLEQTIKLKPNLKFSTGAALTSADVVATIERSLNDKGNGYPCFYTTIDSVSAPDSTTVVVHLNAPYPSLKTLLAYPNFMILPASALIPEKGKAKAGFFDSPISAGPYMLKSWGGTQTIVMEENPNYAGPKPMIPTVTSVTIPDYSARINQLRSGAIDIAESVPPSMVSQVKSIAGAHVVIRQQYGFFNINMNNDAPPLDNANVRRAISLAIDRSQIAKMVLPGVSPLSGFWPQTTDGYDDTISVKPDVAEAKRLLAATKYASGFDITLYFQTNDQPWSPQEVAIIQSNLAEIGINVKTVQYEQTALLDKVLSGKYQMALWGLYDLANIPDGMLGYGLLQTGGINANFSGYHSAEMDQLAQTANQSTGTARTNALADISALFQKDMPYAILQCYFQNYGTRLADDVAWVDESGFIQVGRAKN